MFRYYRREMGVETGGVVSTQDVPIFFPSFCLYISFCQLSFKPLAIAVCIIIGLFHILHHQNTN
jgi:hypothetical protein